MSEPVVDKEVFVSKGEEAYAKEMLGDDPDYQKAVMEKPVDEKPADEKPVDENPEEEKPADEKPVDEKPEEETLDGDKPSDETPSDETPTEEKKEEVEYEDNVIPELTGKQFASLPEDVREIVAKTSGKLEELTNKGKETESRLQKLLNDPIVKHREEIITTGKGQLLYELPKLTDQQRAEIISYLDSDTPESRKKADEILDGVVKQAAELGESNARLLADATYHSKESLKSAANVLLKLGELNPDLKCDITDPEKIISTPFEKLGKLGEGLKILTANWSKSAFIHNIPRHIAEKKPEALYAEMAAELGLPVILNADKKIRDIVKKSNQALADRFRKNKDGAGGKMPAGKDVDSKKIKNGQIVEGIDIAKLASNDEYHEKMLYKNSADLKWVDKITRLRERGERFLKENPDLSSST